MPKKINTFFLDTDPLSTCVYTELMTIIYSFHLTLSLSNNCCVSVILKNPVVITSKCHKLFMNIWNQPYCCATCSVLPTRSAHDALALYVKWQIFFGHFLSLQHIFSLRYYSWLTLRLLMKTTTTSLQLSWASLTGLMSSREPFAYTPEAYIILEEGKLLRNLCCR